LKGRYYIREGNYIQGVKDIEKMIAISLEICNYDYALKMASVNINYKEEGILLRLKGLNKIMCYEYEEAEEGGLLLKHICA